MASTGSIAITRPMKKVTQVSPRKVSATDSRVRAVRLATLLARLQACGAIAFDCKTRHPDGSRAQRGVAEGPVFADASTKQVPRLRFAPLGMTGKLLIWRQD